MREPVPYLWVVYGCLIFCAFSYLALGLGMSLGGGMAWLMTDPGDPPMPEAIELGFSIMMLVVCAGVALLNVVAAFGLSRRAKWGWFVSLGLAALYAPSGCLPFGVAMLLVLLRTETRSAFEV